MKSDTYIKREGIKALKEKLGVVDMERFIMIINREKFNYTEWRKGYLEDLSLEELAYKAETFSKELNEK